jgi:two-component system nitrate/nitrite response regulator NarL
VDLISVVVADDDALFRSALVETLVADDRFVVVGESPDGLGVVDLVRSHAPHVVLVDVRMPGGGPELCRALLDGDRAHRPVLVAVSADLATTTVSAMVGAGASGYLGKGRLGDELGDWLVRCTEGETVLAVPRPHEVWRRLEEDRAAAV